MGRYDSYTSSVMVPPPTTREHHHPQWHLWWSQLTLSRAGMCTCSFIWSPCSLFITVWWPTPSSLLLLLDHDIIIYGPSYFHFVLLFLCLLQPISLVRVCVCVCVCAWINVARSNETFQRKGDELTHSLIHGRNCSHRLFIAFCCCMHAVGVYVRGNSSGACCCKPWSRHTLLHFLVVGMQQQQVKPGTALQQSLDSWEIQAAKAVEVKKTTWAPDAVKEEPKEGVKGCKG